MDIFSKCIEINNLISEHNDVKARNELIKLLDYHKKEKIAYSEVINSFIRQLGLYPYLDVTTSDWQERLIYEAFKVEVGNEHPVTLHKEQSLLLKKLLEGKSLAISAPTSFGKSFIIDAFIALRKPDNIVIIVPTIALTDETRRRIFKKFGDKYKIITTSEASLSDRNIFIFPQERAIRYVDKLDVIDLLIVDEFYKASNLHDKDRSPILIDTILKLSVKSKQRYFLAPNISSINDNIITKEMEFISVNFNTVYLEINELFGIKAKGKSKSEILLSILGKTLGKTLIYAGTFKYIDEISEILTESQEKNHSNLCKSFSSWLIKNYGTNWMLPRLVKSGIGIHNGRLHRSLSQIQVKLFDEQNGIKTIISTSSIIEGVNTSAENIVIWCNKNGRSHLKNFDYKNLVGRGGRMFKHFIGKIYILEEQKPNEESQLQLEIPDSISHSIDQEHFKNELTKEQLGKIIEFKQLLHTEIGFDLLSKLKKDGVVLLSNSNLIREIAIDIKNNPNEWIGIKVLNSTNPKHWKHFLFKIIKKLPHSAGIEYRKLVLFIEIISKNWDVTIPNLLNELKNVDIDINIFFSLEKKVTFDLSAILNDVNILLEYLLPEKIEISSFIAKVSNAFLPPLVYQLEEYGLPRMISKKIHMANIINLEEKNIEIYDLFDKFNDEENKSDINRVLIGFEKYIFYNFIDGITSNLSA